MGCGASSVAPVEFEPPHERAKRERREEAERQKARLARRRRITGPEKAELDAVPGRWADSEVFEVFFEDFYIHYRSKYTVWCLQDLKKLSEDAYDWFVSQLGIYISKTDPKFHHAKPSVIKENVTMMLPLYLPGRERADTISMLANYFMTEMGREGYCTKHQVELMWPRLQTQVFCPIIDDAKARKDLIHRIAKCASAPSMSKHIRTLRAIENDTGNDSSLPLTPEETELLRRKPYKWTDPTVFLAHMEGFWQHYAKDRMATSAPSSVLVVMAQEIVQQIMGALKLRVMKHYPSLSPSSAEFNTKLGNYIRKSLPVNFAFLHADTPLHEASVQTDICARVEALLSYHLDHERTGVVSKDAVMRYFPPLYLRAFDYDQKFTQAHVHTPLDAALAAQASNAVFTSGHAHAQAQAEDAPQPRGRSSMSGAHLMVDVDEVPLSPRSPRKSVTKGFPPSLSPSRTPRHAHTSGHAPGHAPYSPRSPRQGAATPTATRGSIKMSSPLSTPRASASAPAHAPASASTPMAMATMHEDDSDHAHKRVQLAAIPHTRTLHTGTGAAAASAPGAVAELPMQSFTPRQSLVTANIGPKNKSLPLKSSSASSAPVGAPSTLNITDKAAIRALLTAGGAVATPKSAPGASPLARLHSLQTSVSLDAVPADVLARLPQVTIRQLPLLQVWPLALSSTVSVASSTSALGPEDLAQPAGSARRLSVWTADVSSASLMPLDDDDETEIDRERLRRLTLFAASSATVQAVQAHPPIPQYRCVPSNAHRRSPSPEFTLPRAPTGAGEHGSLRQLAHKRLSSGSGGPGSAFGNSLGLGAGFSARQGSVGSGGSAQDEFDDDLPSDASDDEEDGEQEVKIPANLFLDRRRTTDDPFSLTASARARHASDMSLSSFRNPSSLSAGAVLPALAESASPSPAVQPQPQPQRPVSPSPDLSPSPEEEEEKKDEEEEMAGLFAGLDIPTFVNGKFTEECSTLEDEVEATLALFNTYGISPIPDAAVLRRPPFAKLHVIIQALQQHSMGKLFTGDLADQLFPEAIESLTGKSPESKEMRLSVCRQWVSLTCSRISQLENDLANHDNYAMLQGGRIAASDAQLLISSVSPLRTDASRIATNITTGKGVEITNRLLQVTMLFAHTIRQNTH